MPIYVYKCGQCSEYHEALQKASDPLLTTCPFCQAEALTKVIAPVGVIFKGTGFHKNDYSAKAGSGSASKPAAEKASESASTGSAASSGGDSGGSSGGDSGSSTASSGSNSSSSGGDKVA